MAKYTRFIKNDQNTKAFFGALRVFWSLFISAGTDGKTTPLLTISVNR
jgi:hypothetical protein